MQNKNRIRRIIFNTFVSFECAFCFIRKHGKTCCGTTLQILKQLDLMTLRGKREDIIHKHGKTCCRTTFQKLKQLDLLTLRGKRENIIHKHGKTCCRTTFHILKQLDLLILRGKANVKISYTNTTKHAAGQHFKYSKNSTY